MNMHKIIIKKWKSGRGFRYRLQCNNCGREFEKTGRSFWQDKCLFCSCKCSNNDKRVVEKINKAKQKRVKRLGCLFSIQARERMSEAQKIRFTNPVERKRNGERTKKWIAEKGHPRGMLGKTAWNKGKENLYWKGCKNPNWNSGSSYGDYGDEFGKKLKGQIRSRDNFTCQICGEVEKKIETKIGLPPYRLQKGK